MCLTANPPPAFTSAGVQPSSSRHLAAKRREQRDRLLVSGDVRELRADVDVEACDLEPEIEGALERPERGVGRQPELRAVMPGLDRLVRVGLDAERHADQHPTPVPSTSSGSSSESSTIVAPGVGGGQELARRLRIPVHDERSPSSPAARANASSPAEATSAPMPSSAKSRRSATFGKAFGAVDDERLRHRSPDLARSRAERVLAVDDEGRSEALRELARPQAPEDELAPLDSRGIREELEHPPILPVTLFSA